ncbi:MULTISPECIES: LamB/YcsF family protein [Pseudomonas]|uniref:5-oxoprolinase subunit A n=1 Tax=Pseudomonas taiwanensis TaxID=470150 RepID=A0ABR6V5T7_9PSED|nr:MULTISPECIES: 5-oxoprolinase subunit PxpA [Pseudomonas]MBC3475791.1 5-oxoprolinase subunit PxpA [Pseudomonas taiwanensis]BDM22258.1 5-oxoprolinase subunit PxpA [Pseudomonas sp. LRP2-20]
MQIDLNCDMGEGFGPYSMGDDEGLLRIVSSANIACGFHAGDPLIMTRTVALAAKNGVDIGAHPGFHDLRHFGRRQLPLEPSELRSELLYQLGALSAITRDAGHKLTHLSFHGALGNRLFRDEELADILVKTVHRFDSELIFPVVPNGAVARAAMRYGMRTHNKFFSDRAYGDDGMLVPRGNPGATIKDPEEAARRVTQLLDSGTVTTITGNSIRINASVIMVHGDGPNAVEIAQKLRVLIENGGGVITPLSAMR